MKQATGALNVLALCGVLALVRSTKMMKARTDEDKPVAHSSSVALAKASKAKAKTCLTHRCSDGYHLKMNFSKLPGDATDQNCCNPTCKFWTCSDGWKSHVDYSNNVGASDKECCDKTCIMFTGCALGYGVPESKKNIPGVTKDQCCRPRCSNHMCIGDFAPDPAKLDLVAASNSECCAQSCAKVTCDNALGLVAHPDRQDKAGNTTEYCCQKVCKAYADQCPANTGVADDMRMEVVPATLGLVEASSHCCSGKCSGHSCPSGWLLKPSRLNEFVSKATSGCCEQTCAAHMCSKGWARLPGKDNDTNPSDLSCCEPTCEQYICPHGYFNSTDPLKLASANRSSANCCEGSCAHYACVHGTELRPHPATVPLPGNATVLQKEEICCEYDLCADLRQNYQTLGAQIGNDTNGPDCSDLQPDENCSNKFVIFVASSDQSIEHIPTFVPCVVDKELNVCKLDDTRVVQHCSEEEEEQNVHEEAEEEHEEHEHEDEEQHDE